MEILLGQAEGDGIVDVMITAGQCCELGHIRRSSSPEVVSSNSQVNTHELAQAALKVVKRLSPGIDSWDQARIAKGNCVEDIVREEVLNTQ
jgi:hypothetical protein